MTHDIVRKRILVVEDDPDKGAELKEVLHLEGYDVTLVTYMRAAALALHESAEKEELFDAVVSDYYFPIFEDSRKEERLGFDVLRELRYASDAYATTPFILHTSSPDPEAECKKRGVTYCKKGISSTGTVLDLLEKVFKQTQKHPA